jgi:hypothetical protein
MPIIQNIIGDPRYNTEDKMTLLHSFAKVQNTVLNNPSYSKIVTQDFLIKPPEEQLRLYDSYPEFKEANITLSNIINFIKSCNNLQKENLESKIYNVIVSIIKNQDNGRWDKWISSYDRNFEKQNAWAHCVLTRTLIKWERISDSFSSQEDKIKLSKAIKDAVEHLQDSDFKIQEDSLWGWSQNKNTGKINIYDTSFALTTISHFKECFTENLSKLTLDTLIHRDFIKNDGSWSSEREKESDTGATAYALLSLMHCKDLDKNTKDVEIYNKHILKGISWLIEKQLNDGGWSQSGKNNEPQRVDRTCYILNALHKYSGTNQSNDLLIAIKKGISFLDSELRLTYKNVPYRYWSWLDDDSHQPSVKNSSYAVSALLRCGVFYDSPTVENGILGLFRMIENENQPPLYFNCSLIDYLRFKYFSFISGDLHE